MTYQGISHVAIRVTDLREAEDYYRRLLGLTVAFRETETSDGWWTLPPDAGWEDADAAGISPTMCLLTRDDLRVAMEEVSAVDAYGVVDHVGLLLEPKDLQAVHDRIGEVGASIVTQRDTLLIIDDRYGVRWELTTIVHHDVQAESHGARQGRWLDLDSHVK